MDEVRIEALSAVTLGTHDMARALEFYGALGFELRYGGVDAELSSFIVGSSFLNLIRQPDDVKWAWWGRVILHVSDVDAMHALALAAGLQPHAEPRDAPWGERFFHLTDPDGHELAFARPINTA